MKSEGGWQAFREASKAKTQAEDEESTAGAAREGDPTSAVEEDAADLGSDPDIAAWNNRDMKPDAGEADAEETGDHDEAEAAKQAEALLESPLAKAKRRVSGLLGSGKLSEHWYVLAIVPVAATASLIAVRAGLNPYALCLEWWDVLFGSVFFVACVTFLGFAVFRGARGRWHPGIPALAVAIVVIPFWLGANAAFHSACQEIPVQPSLLPPLPPPIDVPTVPNMWPAPMPQPRPEGL